MLYQTSFSSFCIVVVFFLIKVHLYYLPTGIYWTNHGSSSIFVHNITLGKAYNFIKLQRRARPNDLAVLGGYLYWTDERSSQLFRFVYNHKLAF